MSGLDVLFLAVVLVPLFVGQWRVSMLGLAAQGVLLWVAAGGPAHPLAPDAILDGVDFVLVRAALAPALLSWTFGRPGVPARRDVIPPNLFAWMVVVGLVLVTTSFAGRLDPAAPPTIGVAGVGLVAGLFILSTQESVFSQIVGALRIENAVALLEVAATPHDGHAALAVRALHVLVTAGSVALYVWYLRALTPTSADGPEGEP